MRLACPNCGAQYEVPADAIPPGGRDVQCSACGRTWLERGVVPGLPGVEGVGFDVADLDEPNRMAEGAPRVEGDEEEEDDLAEVARPDASWSGAPVGRAGSLAPPPPASGPEAGWVPRSTVTPEVAEILRAEALREATAREREMGAPAPPRPTMPPEPASLMPPPGRRSAGGASEGAAPLRSLQAIVQARRAAPQGAGSSPGAPSATRPGPAADPSPVRQSAVPAGRGRAGADVPAASSSPAPQAIASTLPGAVPDIAVLSNIVLRRAEEARRRMARLRALAEAAAPRDPSSQRDPLFGVATASPSPRPAPATSPPALLGPFVEAPRGRRPGFRRGFAGVLLLAACLAALYAAAPRITAALPATAPILGPFADAVDEGRLWLDLRFRALLRAVQGSEAEATPGAPLAAPAAIPDALPGAVEDASTSAPHVTAPVGEAPAALAAPVAETAPAVGE